MELEKKLAVLIDADNISSKYIEEIMAEVVNYGTPTYKRIYGDWTTPQLSGWKEVLLENSIIPIQQYSYTAGKNSTDSALIIDAMDILYSRNVDGFCIISSDSDFTRLASRLREAGMYVLGMGEAKTPKPFITACESFQYLESLLENGESLGIDANHKEVPQQVIQGVMSREKLTELIKLIVEEHSDEDEWISLSNVGIMLKRRFPDFDPRNYKCPKLLTLVKSLGLFDVEKRGKQPYIRNKVK